MKKNEILSEIGKVVKNEKLFFNIRKHQYEKRKDYLNTPVVGNYVEKLLYNKLHKIAESWSINKKVVKEVMSVNAKWYDPFTAFYRELRTGDLSDVERVIDLLRPVGGWKKEERTLFRKWLVSIVASMDGKVPEMMAVLTGEGGTGKSTFFEQLLPSEWADYRKMGGFKYDKDCHIAMASNLLWVNNEMVGMGPKHFADFKSLCTVPTITERLPYRAEPETTRRTAVLCGTTNLDDFYHENNGNRRILPIELESLSYEKYLHTNKYELFSGLKAIYLRDKSYSWRPTVEEHGILNDMAENFKYKDDTEIAVTALFSRSAPGIAYFLPVHELSNVFSTHARQLAYMDNSAIGRKMKSLGFERTRKSIKGKQNHGYIVYDRDGFLSSAINAPLYGKYKLKQKASAPNQAKISL